MGQRSADTLMGLLPPVGWADVATKQDLHNLGDRLDAKIELVADALKHEVVSSMRHELNGMVLKMFALVVAFVPALVIPLLTLT